jgi:hypothetical protein
MRAQARVAVMLGAVLLGCEGAPTLPAEHPARQRMLGERILARLYHLETTAPGERGDVALAIAEVVMPTEAPRLRLAVAGDDPTLAQGAALALARILDRREGAVGLATCARSDTNPFVRSACLRELAVEQPQLARGIEAPGVAGTPWLSGHTLRPVKPLLDSDDPEQRREGLRILLTVPQAEKAGEPRLENALVHALSDKDARVVLLASAVFLRRSLRVSPPPADAAVPDSRTP